MKKVLALALALILTLTMGLTAFADPAPTTGLTIVRPGYTEEFDPDFQEFPIEEWDINNENVVALPYNYGDFALMIDGTEAFEALFGPEVFNDQVEYDTLSSIKVESQKGLINATVYKLDDYAKELPEKVFQDAFGGLSKMKYEIETKSAWPFEDFDLEDLMEAYGKGESSFYYDEDNDEWHLDLYFVYFDFPTYAGAKVSTDNYFTLKFRENATGEDHIATSEKVWFCVTPFAVFDDDVETYADENEAMELDEGYPLIGEEEDARDFVLDAYDMSEEEIEGHLWVGGVRVKGEVDMLDYIDFEIDETPYVITKDAWSEIIGSTLIVGVDDDFEVEIGKIVKGQSGICFFFDTDVDDNVQDLNKDAELVALKFLDASNVLDSDFTVKYTFEIEDAAKAGDYFLYELVGDKLTLNQKVAVGKGDDEVEVKIERKAGDTLGQYYLSDVELATEAAAAGEEENPNTGASEVAGVAVALAVISLVSAAAVALKK